MEVLFEWLKSIALIFSVFASAYSLLSILKDKPKVSVELVDSWREEGYLKLKLSFQNTGRQMSSVYDYLLKVDEQIYNGLQEVKKISILQEDIQ